MRRFFSVDRNVNVDLRTKIQRVIIGGVTGGVMMALLLLLKIIADD